MTNPIITENQNTPGTTAWKITNHATTEIQAYATTTSLAAGSTISFCVSTQVASTAYTLNIYRIGYYNGFGGSLKYTAANNGIAQGYWDLVSSTPTNCPTAIIDNTTHLCDAGWAVTDTWAIPANATTGIYEALFQDANGKQHGVAFVVKGNATADYAVSRPHITDQAYNEWGGYSLYTNPTVGVKVSFNRPMLATNGVLTQDGTGTLSKLDIAAIKWLEKQGYNLSYLSDVDVHGNPAQLLSFKAYLVLGHAEYWSKAMRDGVEAAIAGRVGAAFLGANDCYWQVRFENDHAGNPNRTVVCYKVTTVAHNLALDPQYGVNNAIVTTLWRDPVVGRPENTMMGIMFLDSTNGANTAWTVDSNADQTYFADTGLARGGSYGSDVVGYEWDAVQSGGPANLKIIGTSSQTNKQSQPSTSNTTTYIAPSGALVFATGSIDWTWALDGYRWAGGQTVPIPQIQKLMANIMGALIWPIVLMMFESNLVWYTRYPVGRKH